MDRRMKRYLIGVGVLCVDERKAAIAALRAARGLRLARDRERMENAVADIVGAIGRTDRRRKSDRRMDGKRRKLIGARVKHELAERVERCAAMAGMSKYRFAVTAFERLCYSIEREHRTLAVQGIAGNTGA